MFRIFVRRMATDKVVASLILLVVIAIVVSVVVRITNNKLEGKVGLLFLFSFLIQLNPFSRQLERRVSLGRQIACPLSSKISFVI